MAAYVAEEIDQSSGYRNDENELQQQSCWQINSKKPVLLHPVMSFHHNENAIVRRAAGLAT
ncbi:MAG TPA: hypothetical protein VHO91_04020 [Rhodopila sp.]|nr:hypothetical protein [Rhodopila sp.]